MAQNGGPAFPIDRRVDDDGNFINGMTLRDYFADSAIKLFPLDKKDIEKLQTGCIPQHDIVAQFCYDLADAMIIARNV